MHRCIEALGNVLSPNKEFNKRSENVNETQ